MWSEMSAFVLGGAGVLVSAAQLLRPGVRRVSTIKGEAELVSLMPPSPARDALYVKVQGDVWQHVRIHQSSEAWRWVRGSYTVAGLSLLLGFGLVILGLVYTFNDYYGGSSAYGLVFPIVGMGITLAGFRLATWMRDRAGEIAKRLGRPGNNLIVPTIGDLK